MSQQPENVATAHKLDSVPTETLVARAKENYAEVKRRHDEKMKGEPPTSNIDKARILNSIFGGMLFSELTGELKDNSACRPIGPARKEAAKAEQEAKTKPCIDVRILQKELAKLSAKGHDRISKSVEDLAAWATTISP